MRLSVERRKLGGAITFFWATTLWILQTSKQWELIKTEKSKGAIDTSSRIFLFASSRPGHELHSQLNDNWSVWTIDPPPAWKSSEVASVFAQKLGVKLTREGVQWVKSQHFEEWSSLWAILQQASLETKNISSELLARLRDKSEHTMFRLADCVNHKDWQTLASLLRETAPSVSARVQEFRFLNSHFTKMLLLESAPGKESLYYKKIRQARKLYSEEEIEEWILRLTEWERLSKIDPPFLTHRLGAELCNLV